MAQTIKRVRPRQLIVFGVGDLFGKWEWFPWQATGAIR